MHLCLQPRQTTVMPERGAVRLHRPSHSLCKMSSRPPLCTAQARIQETAEGPVAGMRLCLRPHLQSVALFLLHQCQQSSRSKVLGAFGRSRVVREATCFRLLSAECKLQPALGGSPVTTYEPGPDLGQAVSLAVVQPELEAWSEPRLRWQPPAAQQRIQAPAGTPPIVILPGFGNCSQVAAHSKLCFWLL